MFNLKYVYNSNHFSCEGCNTSKRLNQFLNLVNCAAEIIGKNIQKHRKEIELMSEPGRRVMHSWLCNFCVNSYICHIHYIHLTGYSFKKYLFDSIQK